MHSLEVMAQRSLSSLLKLCVCLGAVQRRTMFIQTQSTPNPSSLMFSPGKPVMEMGSADFPNSRSAMGSPLAKAIFSIDGISCDLLLHMMFVCVIL